MTNLDLASWPEGARAICRRERSWGLTLASNEVQINLLHHKIERNGVLDAARRLGVTLMPTHRCDSAS